MDSDFNEELKKIEDAFKSEVMSKKPSAEVMNTAIRYDISAYLRIASESLFEINKKLGELILIQNTKSK